MNDLSNEERLSRSLHDRADRLPTGSPIGLDDVRNSARSIRRRRRLAAGAAVAAVVAIAVPVGLSATSLTQSERPVGPATSSPSVDTPSPSPTPDTPTPSLPQPGAVIPLTTDGLERGAPAGVAYLVGSTLHTPEGGTAELPAAYTSIYPYRGGWLAIENRDGTPYVVELDGSLDVVRAVPGGDRIAVGADGVELAWFEAGRKGGTGRLVLDVSNGHSESGTTIDLPGVQAATPVGFVAPGTVVYRTEGRRPATWVASTDGIRQVPDVLGARAANQAAGLIGAQTSDNPDGTSCWAVLTRTSEEVWRTCDDTLEAFSPDGRLVAGFPSNADGLGSSTVVVRQEDGSPQMTFERPGKGEAFVSGLVWEDERHLLATVFEHGSWHLLRLGADGSVELVDEAPGEDFSSPIHFAAVP